MMKWLFFIFIFLLSLTGCETSKNIKTKNTEVKNIFQTENKEDFTGLDYSTEVINRQPDLNINNLNYKVIFSFTNKNISLTVDYSVTDENDKILLSKTAVRPVKDMSDPIRLTISDSFISKLYYSKLKYTVKVNKNGTINDFTGETISPDFPVINIIDAGPIISKYVDNVLNVSLILSIDISNCSSLKWIRFIPPSRDYFWNIPWTTDSGNIKANATIYEKNKKYIENGIYMIQVNFEKSGIYQKEIQIIDFLNNSKGANYGLPVSHVVSDDREYLKLDISDMDKADYMELWLFSKENDSYKKIGSAKLEVNQTIVKKNLKNIFIDTDKNIVKIKNNTEYFCQIYLYSREYNSLKYLSISDYFPVKFHGFSIPFFN